MIICNKFEENEMKCIKCENEMTKSRLSTGPAYVYAENRTKGLLPTIKRTAVSCYVCSKCGYIELYADSPKDINL